MGPQNAVTSKPQNSGVLRTFSPKSFDLGSPKHPLGGQMGGVCMGETPLKNSLLAPIGAYPTMEQVKKCSCSPLQNLQTACKKIPQSFFNLQEF